MAAFRRSLRGDGPFLRAIGADGRLGRGTGRAGGACGSGPFKPENPSKQILERAGQKILREQIGQLSRLQ